MNKFLQPFFLLLTFSICTSSVDASSVWKDVEYLTFDLCLENFKTNKQDIQHFNYSVSDASIFSLNCATPTILTSGGMVSGNTSGGDLYYQITIPAGQNASYNFLGVPGATAEFISSCAVQSPIPAPYCGGGTFLIKISGNTGPFDLTVTAYTNSVTIGIVESSATNNTDGTLCEGEDITLTANPVLTGGATVSNYDWSSGQTTQGFTLNNVSAADAGTYTVTVTDNTGCTSSSSVMVIVNPLPTAAINLSETSGIAGDGEICNGDQATLTASGGNTYAWSNGVNTDINLVAPISTTTYTVTVTDSNGCTDTEEQQIVVNPLPTAGIDIAETSGISDNDGDICENDPIMLTATGGGTYEWSTTETTEDISPVLGVGAYTFTVTITDTNGCTDSETVSVEVFPAAMATIAVTEMSGNVDDDGMLCFDDEVTLTATGGTSYNWNTGGTTAVINDFPPVGMTTYTVTVTDVNGCTASTETTVEVFDLPIADITVTDMSAENDDDGLICFGDDATLTATGANGGTYSWSSGEVTDVITVSPAVGLHTYTVTVTDINGCTDTDMFDIEVFALPMPTITIAETSALLDNDGILCAGDDLTLTGVDADPMTMFEWTLPNGTVLMGNPLIITNIDNTFNGVFTVTADNNGCTNTAMVTITVSDPPDPVEIQFEGSGANFTVCQDEMFSLDATVGAGSGTYTYNWTLPNGSTQTGNPISFTADQALHQGTWNVTVTDNFGCTGTDNIQVTVDPAPPNNSCGTAIATTTGASGTNVCANTGGGCGANSESAVYYTYTVPMTGLTSLTVEVSAPHVVSVSTACGGGDCTQSQTIDCPTPGAVYYITVSSSEADEGNFNLTVREELQPSTINGTVYIDLDANGTFGGTDVGFDGAPIQLLQGCGAGGAVVATGTSGADGTFSFANVPPGSYLVQIQEGAPGSPTGSSSPKNCCLTVDPCMPATLVCDLGFPPPNCTSNPYSVDNFCEQAYDNPLCNLTVIGDFACGQNPSEQGPWSGISHCGGVYHNTSFYGFVAGTGSYQIQFTIFNCAGSGVQYGLMDVCSPGGPYVVCNGNANTGTVTVDASSLEPCKTYIFWIDGYSSSVCSYYINVTGNFNVCTIPAINDITIDSDCNPLCPLAGTLPVSVVSDPGPPSIENINGALLYWDITFPDGSTINELVTSIQDDGVTIDVPFTQPGEYEICVRSWHPCPAFSAPFCKKFTLENIPDTANEFKVCTGDFPWIGEFDDTGMEVKDIHGNQWAWQYGMEVTLASVRGGQFTYNTELTNDCGCRYTQQLRITEATAATGIDTLAVCQSQVPYTYNGLTFTQAVTDSLIKLNLTSKNGCDSLVSLTSKILNMDGAISDDCVQGGFELQYNMALQFINADRDSIKYVWKDAAGNVLTDNNSDPTNIVVTAVGTYTVEVTVFKYGTGCTFPKSRTIDLTGRLPLAPIDDNWPLKICENDNIATYNVVAPDPTLTYLWTVPATATKVMDDSTGTLIVRWNGPTGGDICVKARNLCGDGPTTCKTVVFVDQIDPNFSMATEVCKDNTTPITATSTHTATPVVYNWNFDGGSSANTNGTGPGPHNVSWNSVGPKTVSLTVTENGCTGDPITKPIEVSELPPPPIINCAGSTSTSVTFGWTAVLGATSYNVIVVSPAGISGTIDLTNNTYTVSGLALGASVTIQVVAVLDGPCGNVTSAAQTCTAQDCGTLPTITLSPIAPICLPGTVLNLDASLVTVTPTIPNSVGTFAVNGVAATTFNPTALGAGTHNILYTLTWNNARCSQSGSTQVVVNETPLSDFTVSPGGCVLDPVTVTYTGGTTGATYTWNFGPDVIGNYNGAGPHNVTWTNAGAKTITLTVAKNGCTSTVTTRNVTVNPVLANPQVSCADQRIDGVTFGWTSVPNASGYNIVVNIVGGANIFTGAVTGTMYDVPGLTVGTQVSITVTAISSNGCPNTTGSQTCIATSCPKAIFTFTKKVINECLYPSLGTIPLTYTIANNLPNEVPTVTWSSSSPSANSAIDNSVSPSTFDPQKAGVGPHTLVLTYQQKECIWKDSILITLKPKPVASFTMMDKICINESPTTVTYTGTATGGRVLTWDDGGATRSVLTPTSFGFAFPAAGSYTIGLTTTLNDCVSDLFTKSIVVEDFPATPVITCVESLDAITFSWTSVPCATEYDVLINGVLKGRQSTRTYTVNNLQEGEKIDLEVKAISTCECPIAPVSETCTAKACPPVVIVLTPGQANICLTPNVSKIPITPSITGETSDGKGIWSGVGVDQNGIFDPVVAGLGTHEITYSYKDSNCDFEEKTSITVNGLPIFDWENTQPNCYNDLTGGFIYTMKGGKEPYTFTIDGKAVGASPIKDITAGSHIFVVTDANGCSSSQSFAITVPSQPSFNITGPAIVNIKKQATHTLDLAGMAAYINKIDSVVWFWNGVRVCSGSLATCSSITNTPPVGPNSYVVTIYYNNGCKVVDDFSYVVTDTYITTFPNIINPTSSSGNREFRIFTNDPSLFVKKMRVYDRWGNLAFIAENFSASDPKGWNGTFGGADVVPGVFVYIFEMTSDSDDDIVETGDVTVVR
ncbi:MAG: hypothetical protein IPN86_08575 [Saprospiraceae bacterium]|nr:hypothetical protein [Saprospiraceae bacterium]